ncbi:MAG: membrane protein insertase YidC [Telluria sp.]
MEFNKRTLLWIVFIGSTLMLWDQWMVSNGKGSMFGQPPAKVASAPAGAAASANASLPAAVNGAVPAAAAPAATAEAPAFKPERITITTDVVKADIDTAGGTIERLELLNYKKPGKPAIFGGCFGLPACAGSPSTGNQVLFDKAGADTYLAETGLVGGPFPNHTTGFVAKPGARTLGNGNEVQLVLEAEQGGVKLTKTFTFKRGDYVIGVRHDVTNVGTAPVAPQLYLQLVHDGNKPAGSSWYAPVGVTAPAIYTDTEHYQKISFDNIEKGKAEHPAKSDNGWTGIIQHFFVAAFIPPQNTQRDIFTKKVDTNLYAVGTVQPLGTVAPGATVSNSARLYAGPQETHLLEGVAKDLDLVKDYSWLAVVAKPLWWVMEKLHVLIGNWGWTIVAFTILIKLAFFPLSAAGYRSMAKTGKVGPKLQAIRERYKDDPAKMNQATMELFKAEKINPFGSCLPLLLQMPVFLALYWVLQASVEMRGAPWTGWITDLSQPDPWFVLPTLYVITMFITTKLNPKPTDPVQAKMMLFMPLMFGVMFFFFPAGLVLYWVVSNIFGITQQVVIKRRFEAK